MPLRVQSFKTVLPAEQVKTFITLPEDFTGKVLELIIRPVETKRFRSLSLIRIDTTTFTFNRDEANARLIEDTVEIRNPFVRECA